MRKLLVRRTLDVEHGLHRPSAWLRPSLALYDDGVAFAIRVELVQPFDQATSRDSNNDGEVLDKVLLPLDVAPLAFVVLGDELSHKHGLSRVAVPDYRPENWDQY